MGIDDKPDGIVVYLGDVHTAAAAVAGLAPVLVNQAEKEYVSTYRVFRFFLKQFSVFCHPSLTSSTGLLIVVQKWPINRAECTLALIEDLFAAIICRRGMCCSGFG